MTCVPKFYIDEKLGKVGSGYSKGSADQLRAKTFVAPSVVIPRVKRLFNFWGAVDEFKPQRERGLFTNSDISQGSYIGTYEGLVVDWEYLSQIDETTDYVLWEKLDGKGILGQNLLRMANHEPISRANMFRLGFNFYAASNILSGEELTWSYDGTDNEFGSVGASQDLSHIIKSNSSRSNPAAQPS